MKEKKFDSEIKALLKDDCIKYRTALFLQTLAESERPLLLRMFREIKLGLNKQREIIEWLEDVKKRDNKPVDVILSELELEAILEDPMQNAPQKGDLFKNKLFTLRFPQVSRYLEQVARCLAQLSLPEEARLSAVNPLEDGEFKLELLIRSPQDFLRLLTQLGEVAQSKPFKELWNARTEK